MPRPVAGLRAEGGQWTPETLAEAAPHIIEQLPPSLTSADAAKFMAAAPVAPKTREPA
jgi:hypothetical protein